jgi:hypothetical protein
MFAMSLAARWSTPEWIWNNPKSLEFLSAISTLILIAGAVIEEWSKLKQIGLLTAKVLAFRSTAFERCVLKKLVTHSIGAILVVVGIVGELVFETRTFIVEDKEATAANLEIGKLEVRARELEQGNLKLQTQVADANERASKAEERAAELLGEIQPRRLSPDQEKDIADALKSYAGKTVGVATYTQDAEAMLLANQIANALGKAKILVRNRIGTFGAVGFPLMLGVIVDKNSSDKKLESALLKTLKTKGGLATLNYSVVFGQGSTMYLPPGPTHEDSFIFVGEKPLAEETLPQQPMSDSGKPSTKP